MKEQQSTPDQGAQVPADPREDPAIADKIIQQGLLATYGPEATRDSTPLRTHIIQASVRDELRVAASLIKTLLASTRQALDTLESRVQALDKRTGYGQDLGAILARHLGEVPESLTPHDLHEVAGALVYLATRAAAQCEGAAAMLTVLQRVQESSEATRKYGPVSKGGTP